MSKRLNIAFYLVCILMLTECEQNTLSVTSPDLVGEERSEIQLNASLVQAEVMPTRNTNFLSNLNLKEQEVGIYASNEATDLAWSKRYISNYKFNIMESGTLKGTPEEGIISLNGNLFKPKEVTSMRLFAYLPFCQSVQDNETNKPKVLVKSGVCKEVPTEWLLAPTDLLWTAVDVKITPKASLVFAHAMSRLNIVINTADEYQNYQLKEISVTLDRVQYGHMLLYSGTIISDIIGPKKTYTENYTESATLAMANNPDHPLFAHTLLPYSVIQKLTLTLQSPEGKDISVTAYDPEKGINAQLPKEMMTMNRGKAKTFVIRYKTENSPATRLGSQLEEHGETIIIDNLP